MRNKKIFIFILPLIVLASIFLICSKGSDNATTLDEVRLKDTNTNKGMFAIMLEKTDDSNEYEESNDFPIVGYLYNGEKSGCIDGNNKTVENVLTYNEETKKVSVKTKQTVYCYLYFKKDSEVPDVTNFYVGTHHGSEYTNQNDNKTVHIEYSDEDVTDYCLTTTNSANECSWESTTSSPIDTTIDLGTDNKKYDYDVYLKDKAGNTSELDEASQDEIILDTQAPLLGNISQDSVTETSIKVSVTAEDPIGVDSTPGSGVKETTYKIRKKRDTSSYIGESATETNETGTTSHTFSSGLEDGTEYTLEVTAVDSVGNISLLKTLDVTTKELSKASDVLTKTPGDYLKQSNKGDLKWRYVGTQSQSSSIKNYVCFGAPSCTGETDNHLYRIIGITDGGNLKIQKNSTIGAYQWANNSNIKWPQSTMYTNTLKNTFYGSETYVSQGMKNKIETNHTWNTGDVTNYSSATSGSYGAKIYEQEKATTSHTGAVGLAYLSDYYFAYNEGGTTNCRNTSCPSWMVPNNTDRLSLWSSQSTEWIMTRYGEMSGDYRAWSVSSDVYSFGNVYWNRQDLTYAVRPVFYLKSDVTISEGEGTLSSPYILSGN